MKYKYNEIIDILKNFSPNFETEYMILNKKALYDTTVDKIDFKHFCGHEYSLDINTALRGNFKCPICQHKNISLISTKDIFILLNSKNEYSIEKELNSSIEIKHTKCGNIITTTLEDFIYNGVRCLCDRNKITFENNIKEKDKSFREKVQEIVKDEYNIISKYTGSKEPIILKHNKCNNYYRTTPNKFLSGNRCPFCSGKKRKTTADFQKEINDKISEEYEVIGVYKNSDTPIDIKYKPTGEIINVVPHIFLSGYGRAKTDKSLQFKKNIEFKEKIRNLVGNEYSVLSDYVNQRTPVLIKHNLCGNEYYINPESFILNGNRCKLCHFKSLTKPEDEFKKEVEELTNDEYKVIGKYISNKTPIEIQHKDHSFMMPPYSFISNGNRCPICSLSGSSKPEDDIEKFLKDELKISNIERNIKFEKNKYELDIYLPNYNIGIEYDGLYWHSDAKEKFQKEKYYHLNKMQWFANKSIRVVNIFEDEWLEHQDIVKDKLKNILGLSNNEKIYARKTEIKEIETKEKNQFLNKYHIQGDDRSNIKIGLFHQNKLVAVMTFVKPRTPLNHKVKIDGEYELSRFACSCNVVGGFSKLLKYFINKYKPNKIITYADLRWSSRERNVYKTNGFIEDHISKPSYWYVKGNKRYYRYDFRKSKLKEKFPNLYDDNKSETQIMKEAKYYKIYDCGNIFYTINIKKN